MTWRSQDGRELETDLGAIRAHRYGYVPTEIVQSEVRTWDRALRDSKFESKVENEKNNKTVLLKGVLWAKSVNVTWKLVRYADSPNLLAKSETLDLRPNKCFNKLSR